MTKAKTYPLDIRSVGDDTYIVMSKGHHAPDEFMRAVRTEGYDWPLGKPAHKWVKVSPCGPSCGEHSCHYTLSDEQRPGWFPATYAWEAYGDDAYKPETPLLAPSVPTETLSGARGSDEQEQSAERIAKEPEHG